MADLAECPRCHRRPVGLDPDGMLAPHWPPGQTRGPRCLQVEPGEKRHG